MNRFIIYFIVLFTTFFVTAQELNCKATVVANQISGSNKQVFKTLEKAINDYMNNTKWTNKTLKKQEKIQCVMTLNIAEQTGSNSFSGNLQIQVVRPVFNSTYLTPVLNYSDADISFTYEEFQPLILNETSFESNLTSFLSFYAYVILGVDADSFENKGGDTYLKKAEKMLLLAQQSGYKGWNSIDGDATRFQLIDGLLNNTYQAYRAAMYTYHLHGLDTMSKDKKKAKLQIKNAVISLKEIFSKRPNAYLLRIFLDTKEDEIMSIFKDGPNINTVDLKEMLMRVYPARNNSWSKIR